MRLSAYVERMGRMEYKNFVGKFKGKRQVE
jgi:hypothetical protein